jgi:hypothetical protein
VEDLEAFLEASGKSAADYRNQMKPKEARSLSCCDGLLHSFKYIQIYPSLKIRKAPDIL